MAAPKIAQFLQTQRVQKAVADETKRLRGAAIVEYQGDFAKAPAATPAPAADPAPAAAPAAK
jgi:hypothetical protein